MDYQTNDVVSFKKKHPCGSKQWVIIRIGMDVKLKCCKCQKIVNISRAKFMESITGRSNELVKTNYDNKVQNNYKDHDMNWIKYVKEPSISEMKQSVGENAISIRYIQNPPDEVIKLAIEKNPYCVQYINNLSVENQKLLLERISIQELISLNKVSIISKFDYIPYELQLELIKNDFENLQCIKNIHPQIYEYLFDNNEFNVYSINDEFSLQPNIVEEFERIKKERKILI